MAIAEREMVLCLIVEQWFDQTHCGVYPQRGSSAVVRLHLSFYLKGRNSHTIRGVIQAAGCNETECYNIILIFILKG